MKSRFVVVLACAVVSLSTLAAGSPTPATSPTAVPTPEISPTLAASPSPSPTVSATPAPSPTVGLTPGPLGYAVQVERGSVLHLQSTTACPSVPKSVKGSKTIVVSARIVGPADTGTSATANGTGRADSKRAWQIDLTIPADAKLGKATVALGCNAGTPLILYYRYPRTTITILDSSPDEGGPNWPQLLILSSIAGLVLGIGGAWLVGRALSRRRARRGRLCRKRWVGFDNRTEHRRWSERGRFRR